MIKPCKQFLAFDDRILIFLGVPVLSMIMPLLLNIEADSPCVNDYGTCHLPHTFIFVVVFWVFYRTLLIKLRQQYPSFEDTLKRNIIQYSIIFFSVPILEKFLSYGVDSLLGGIFSHKHNLPSNTFNLIIIYMPSLIVVLIYEVVYFFMQYKETMIAKERLEKHHVETQLTHLRNQINPHFLFNSLNVLCNLIPAQPDMAMDYLNKLSKFYRYTVDVEEDKLIPLKKEVERAQLYGELLCVRFRDALHLKFENMDHNLSRIPSLALQLLIENAVKHNIVSNESPLIIQIGLSDDRQYVQICNNLQLKMNKVSSTGIGLDNIRKRIAFFTDKELLIEETEADFCVRLPLIT